MFVYISVMLYVHQGYVCIYQCHVVYINVISKAYTSVLYAANRVLNVTNRCSLLNTGDFRLNATCSVKYCSQKSFPLPVHDGHGWMGTLF